MKKLLLLSSFVFLFSPAQKAFSDAADYASLSAEITAAAPNPSVNVINLSTPSIYLQGNLGAIANKTINFQSTDASGNTMIDGAGSYRGFTANQGSNLSFTGINFANASSSADGAFFRLNSSTVSFTGSDVIFSGGSAENGGAIAAFGNSYAHFSGNAFFNSNRAVITGGGGFYSSRSAFVFDGNADFTGNVSEYSGGGFYADTGSKISFNGNSFFRGNLSDNNGAGFFAYRSTVNFAAAEFTNNISSDIGGGFYASQSDIVFAGTASFSANIAKHAGGAFTAGNNSKVSFEQNASFSSNSAGEGAAIRATSSNINFAQDAVFENNSALAGGGALTADMASVITFNGASSFKNNSAGHGGAVSLVSSKLILSDSVFDGNKADTLGGAVYMSGTESAVSLLTVNTAAETVFVNNTAANLSNALYLDNYSRAVFNTAAGASVQMRDAVAGSGSNAVLEAAGAGTFNLYGGLTGLDLILSATSGSSFNIMGGASVDAGQIIIGNGSKFNTVNSSADTVHAASLEINGTLAMEVSETGAHDRIISAGDVNIGAAGALEVTSDLTDPSGFRKKTYMLINTPQSINGTFAGVTVTAPVLANAPIINYGDLFANWITITLLGDDLSTKFSLLKGLSFNQKQVAKNYDALSASASGDLDTVISLIDGMDESGKRKALSQASGYFLANTIRTAAADSESGEIYDRIKNHCVYGNTENAVWAQLRGAAATYSQDDNSPNDFKDASGGVMAGADRFIADKKIMLGAYFKYNDRDIEQGGNEAGITNTGIGFYGGFIEQKWEIKALIAGSYDNYETVRKIPFAARTAKADFNGAVFGADIEGAMKFQAGEYINLRPYLGMEAKNSHYDGFTESGAGSLSLKVAGDSYTRSAARLGAGAVFDNNLFSWYVNAETKYLISGAAPEIESVFRGTGRTFRSRGSTEGNMFFGAAAGAAMRITKELKIFVNGSYFGADKFRNLYGNIGLRWNFCAHNKERIPPIEPKEEFTAEPPLPEPPAEMDAVITFEEDPAENAVIAEPEKEMPREINMDDETVIEQQQKEAALRRSKPVLKSFSLNMANFDTGKSNLTDKAKENIRMQAAEIKKFEFTKITIEGHTDSTGSAAINKKLSRERAKAVFDLFAEEGIPVDKMSYIGFSSLLPAASNNTIEGRAKNRRVEIFVE